MKVQWQVTIHDYPEIRIRLELLGQRLRTISADPRTEALEVALGSGDTTKLLADYFDSLTCVDMEARHIAEVTRYISLFPGARLPRMICGAAETVDLPAQAFEHIVLFGLLEHCQDAIVALNNLKRALKPTGRFHILVNNAGSIHRHLGVELGIIKHVEELSDSDVNFGHYRVYTPATLNRDVHGAGLHVLYTDLHYMKPLHSSLFNQLPIEMHRAFCELGRRFPEFSSYIYLEAALR
jgi:SAM-dependent methyltransferase